MKAIVAKNNWFADSDLRLDASFHLSETTQIKFRFQKSPYKFTSIQNQSNNIFSGNIFRRIYVSNPENGIPYLTGSDMIKSDINSGKFISKKQAKELSNLMLEKDWILVSCSGTLGNTVYTNDLFENKIATHDLIRIIPNNKDVLSGFLYAYLSCKYGYALLTQSSYGGVVKHIEPHHIANIPVPIFPSQKQEKIHNLIVEAADLRVEANRLLEKAKLVLSKKLKLEEENTDGIKTSFFSISKITNSFQQRIDAPVFINEGVKTINRLYSQKVEFKLLSECKVAVTRPGIFKRIYVNNNGLPYIKGSELNLNNPFTNCEHLSKSKTPFLNELKLRENQILMTCAGSVGSVRIITKEFEDKNAIGSQDIIRIVSNDNLFTSEYLFAYFKIPFVYDYIQSIKYGSVIERIEPFHVEKIPIFVPTKDLSKQITEIVRQYKDCVYNAFNKESEAIHLIEKEIDSWQQS